MTDRFGRDIVEIERGWECRDPIDGTTFSVRDVSWERAIDVIEHTLTAKCFYEQAMAELPDSLEGMEDPVFLVGGPLDGQVIDWPVLGAWGTFKTWFGADDTVRAFEAGGATVKYQRSGGTASVLS